MNNILVDGLSFGFVIEPRFQLTPELMIGSKNGLNISTDRIVTLEAQVYLRWNFLSFPFTFLFPRSASGGSSKGSLDIFVQGGFGFIGALKGPYNRFDVRDSRSSILADLTVGVTIPLTSRWHLEPSIRGGYPFITGIAVSAGYKFPLTRDVVREVVRETEVSRDTASQEIITRTEYIEVVSRLMITQVEYILFAGDISRYNVNLDADARSLNDLVLNEVARTLRENPDLRVNIEGHANPVTGDPDEVQILFALSSNRANEVARLLRERGVREEQMYVAAFGAGRVIATDRAFWNMNRRVELIVYQLSSN